MEVKAWREFREKKKIIDEEQINDKQSHLLQRQNKGHKKESEYIKGEDSKEKKDKEEFEKIEQFFKSCIEIPSYSEVSQDKIAFAKAFQLLFMEQNAVTGKRIIQPHPKTIIIQNKPMRPLTEAEMDHVYELPFTGETHPSYKEPVPALEMVKFSLTTHRGCFGGCAFCAITLHQGRMISSRSIESVLREAKKLTGKPDFKGIINGVGGPSANMYGMECPSWEKKGACLEKSCLYPQICPALKTSHKKLIELMHRLRELPRVKQVFTGYGVRYDLALEDETYLEELCAHHISGQLRIAPEHFSKRVTNTMCKPENEDL